MRIALVSDTHAPIGTDLPDALLSRLRGADAILHAGDLVSLGVLEQLNRIAPTTAVAGNMDPPEVVRRLRAREILTLAGRKVGLKHGHQRPELQRRYIGLDYEAAAFNLFFQAMAAQLSGAEIIVFGHFHAPVVKRWNGLLFVNPGAVATTHGRSTAAMLTVDRTNTAVEILDL